MGTNIGPENGKGSILFGGIDTDKFTGNLVSLPIQPDSRSGTIISFTVTLDNFQVIDASKNVAYSQKSLALPVILDSGTTITYLPNNIAQDLMAGVGAVVSSTYGPVVACDLRNSPATFNFGFGNPNGPVIVAALSQFVLPFPPDFPTPTFRSNGKPACRWGLQAANGRPNLFGDTFLRGAYVVYNLDNNEVAIANALLNSTSSNIKEFTNTLIPGVTATATGNAAKYTASGLYGPNTLGFGLGGSQITTATGGTFNLGPTSSATSGSSAGNKKSAGSLVLTPRLPGFGAVAGVVTVLMLMGGSLIIFT
jgi:Eukaryotic aspartyl protease